MDLPKTAEVVIIGGGVMGASTAYHLAQRGQKNIVLLEKERFFGQGASGRNAGGVRYQFATAVNIELSKASLPMIERFPAEIGQEIDYQPCGYLMFITTPTSESAFKQSVALQHSLGVPTEWLTGDEIRRRLPLMALDDVIGGTFYHKDGLVDPNGIVMGYVQRARQLGVKTITEAEVHEIVVDGGRVRGVRTDQGDIAAPLIVNAAGPWAKRIGEMAGLDIPIEPLRRQMLVTTPLPDIPNDFPFVIDFSQSLYFHSEGEGLLIGMSNPHEIPGFDQTVDEAYELEIMERAIARLPLLETAGLAAHWAGLYENTPDAHPIFGPTPVDGFYLVGGFSGHGLMHGPVAGLLMSEIILDGRPSTVDVSMLDFNRFAENRMIVEHNVI